jgi:2Fe-2S ferredoxin
LDVAENFNIFLDHACGGNCACTTCHVWVKQGKESLSEMDDDEADRLDMAADLQLSSRLGCQAVIEKPGEVVVEIPAWNRNYVSEEHH